ncbi:hypothetical protein ACQW02_20720 [Humitalea sp. 24SJ18S-53]|uniref:hypothetical protein n=1 Tax=Humitalea sp. 24SJ18S-53 TaxID=3422307 RepID=UPI003D66BA0D
MYSDTPLTAASFSVLADASAGLLPRLLEPFAKRDLVPDRVRSQRQGGVMTMDITLHAMPAHMVDLVAGNLGQVVGVRRVEAMEGRRVAAA